MSGTKRKVFDAEFKAKVGLEEIHGVKTLNQIAQEHGVHPVQVSHWKKEILERAGTLFKANRGPKAVNEFSEPECLFGEIGKLKMELDWLKKVQVGPVETRRTWVEPEAALPVVRQCELAGVKRAKV